jgi:hypothetical protein
MEQRHPHHSMRRMLKSLLKKNMEPVQSREISPKPTAAARIGLPATTRCEAPTIMRRLLCSPPSPRLQKKEAVCSHWYAVHRAAQPLSRSSATTALQQSHKNWQFATANCGRVIELARSSGKRCAGSGWSAFGRETLLQSSAAAVVSLIARSWAQLSAG